MSKLKKVILSGILLALLIVLNRFISIKTPLLVISFSFVPIMMAAIWLGPKYSAAISGLGDLIVTCTSVHSRNWRAGNMLGQGKNLEEILENMGMVVEGVRTTKAAYELSQKLGVDMPITAALYQILFENKNPKDVVEMLMNRDLRNEVLYDFN